MWYGGVARSCSRRLCPFTKSKCYNWRKDSDKCWVLLSCHNKSLPTMGALCGSGRLQWPCTIPQRDDVWSLECWRVPVRFRGPIVRPRSYCRTRESLLGIPVTSLLIMGLLLLYLYKKCESLLTQHARLITGRTAGAVHTRCSCWCNDLVLMTFIITEAAQYI